MISPGVSAVKVADHPFENNGIKRNIGDCGELGRLVDTERWASKGLLLTAGLTGRPSHSLTSIRAHPIAAANVLDCRGAPTEEERLAVRIR